MEASNDLQTHTHTTLDQFTASSSLK